MPEQPNEAPKSKQVEEETGVVVVESLIASIRTAKNTAHGEAKRLRDVLHAPGVSDSVRHELNVTIGKLDDLLSDVELAPEEAPPSAPQAKAQVAGQSAPAPAKK